MCDDLKSTDVCEHPEKLKDKPGDCTSEQKRECHGDVVEHHCEEGQIAKTIQTKVPYRTSSYLGM